MIEIEPEFDSDSDHGDNWLYIMVTTTEKLREKGKGTP